MIRNCVMVSSKRNHINFFDDLRHKKHQHLCHDPLSIGTVIIMQQEHIVQRKGSTTTIYMLCVWKRKFPVSDDGGCPTVARVTVTMLDDLCLQEVVFGSGCFLRIVRCVWKWRNCFFFDFVFLDVMFGCGFSVFFFLWYVRLFVKCANFVRLRDKKVTIA